MNKPAPNQRTTNAAQLVFYHLSLYFYGAYPRKAPAESRTAVNEPRQKTSETCRACSLSIGSANLSNKSYKHLGKPVNSYNTLKNDCCSMTTEHPVSTQDGYQSDAVVIQVRCDCGDWLKTETRNQQVSCECGKSFAVTVTKVNNKIPFTD
jgi:hypothetical protein